MRREPVVFGIDHARAPIALRERIAFRSDELPAGLAALAHAVDEGLILSTCNRTEIYAVIDRDRSVAAVRQLIAESRRVAPGTLDQAAHVYRGAEAARHLFKVAGGLESMVLGEPQILGQLREALAAARAAGVAHAGITRLATDALRAGKRVRTETGLARNRLSIPHAAIALASGQVTNGLRGRAALVIGAGKMAALAAKLLRREGVAELFIANRTLARGEALAARVAGVAVPLAAIPGLLNRVDFVVGATASPSHVIAAAISGAALGERQTPLLLIDLGVPRTIDPALGELPLVRLRDVDDLEPVAAAERRRADADILEATIIIEEAVAGFVEWWQARPATPAIASLQRRAETIRAEELERALRKLGHLSDRDREVVKALSVGIVNKLLHQPVTRLRQVAGDDPAIGTVVELFGGDRGAIASFASEPAAAVAVGDLPG